MDTEIGPQRTITYSEVNRNPYGGHSPQAETPEFYGTGKVGT